MPARMVAFDTESRMRYDKDVEIQDWKMGCAIRWRTDLKRGDYAEKCSFATAMDLWTWVAEYTREGSRTVVWCHNLGHDARISQVFSILPILGFRLEWCNLDRNVSSMTWRSNHGTLVFADLWTWIPLPLKEIGGQMGVPKYEIPTNSNDIHQWFRYCARDTEIVYHAVSRIMAYIKDNGLGNWQPTGAGMAMAVWRHRFLHHKILVHDDMAAIQAERSAMYTGRAEAWRHGKIIGERWTEVDFRNAYVTIARDYSLPRKLHMSTHALSPAQYAKLRDRFAVLAYCDVRTNVPVLPYRDTSHILWPVGRFQGWYWDAEVDLAVKYGAEVSIKRSYVYVKDPILREWAEWALGIIRATDPDADPIIWDWIKHCSRALIGRIALRTPSWEPWADNPEHITGITNVAFPEEGTNTRLLHIGDATLIETHRMEGKDSLPQVTGYIMAVCRALLWEGMNCAGTENIAHVDTDSILANSHGLHRLRDGYAADFGDIWALKGTYRRLEIWGPRAYRRDKARVTAGIPGKAVEGKDGVIRGERWASLAADLTETGGSTVTVRPATWHIKRTDPRRRGASRAGSFTEPYEACAAGVASSSSMPLAGDGS